MANSDIPFTVVESPDFRQLFHMLNESMTSTLLPKGGDTMRTWLNDIYLQEFESVVERMAESPYKKHLSFDLWTSPGTAGFLAVVAHYFDVSGALQTHLLALPRIRGSHTGENIAVGIQGIVEQFDLTGQLGYFQADNMDSNDTCISAVLAHYNPTLTVRQITALKLIKRVRCTGHILNLVAKAFLEGKNKRLMNSLDPNSQARLSAVEESKLLEEWRKSGPIGKLHFLVHWIRRSPQRRDAFSGIAKGQLLEEEEEEFGAILSDKAIANLQLRADNDTRWHSVYYMIDRALTLRDPLEVFCQRFVRIAELEDESLLTQSDWLVLREIRAILEPFKIITKKFEGRLPNFPEVVSHTYTLHQNLTELYQQYTATFETPSFNSSDLTFQREHSPSQAAPEDPQPATPPTPPVRSRRIPRIPRHFADFEVELPALGYREPPPARDTNPPEPVIELGEPIDDALDNDGFSSIQSSLKLAIKKIEKYIELMDNTPAYWASMILLPDCKTRWIERFFQSNPAKVQSIKANFKRYYDQQYPPVANVEPQLQGHARRPAQRPGFGVGFYDAPEVTQHQDEVRIYLSEPVLPLNESPFQWWQRNRERFPRLSTMAFELLSIPPCSTECERTFSLAKLALSQQRQSTSDETISKLQCVKNWLRN